MIRQLPVATVDAVVDYAHRKAAYFFYDDLEELLQFNITEKVAHNIYSDYFISAIIDVIKGIDDKCKTHCHSRNIPLVALASGIKQRALRSEVVSQSLMRLCIKINDVEFDFEIRDGGIRFLRIDDYHEFEFDSWKESIIDFMEVISRICEFNYASKFFNPLIEKFRKSCITKQIMCETCKRIIEAQLSDVKFRITLLGANDLDNTVTFWIDSPWGELKINSSFDAFGETLATALKEVKHDTLQ